MAQTKTRRRTARSNGNGKPQAKRYAEQTARKADKRREEADGAAAWVAERAGDWDLEAQDYDFVAKQKFLWNPLVDYWFRMEMEGWEKLPDPPALLIGI